MSGWCEGWRIILLRWWGGVLDILPVGRLQCCVGSFLAVFMPLLFTY